MSKDHPDSERFRPYRIDLEPNLFSLMRQALGFDYDDALQTGQGQSLFWPGCALSSYSQDLTLTVYDYLKGQGLVDALSVSCCGDAIRHAGGPDVFKAYTQELTERLLAQGVTRLVVACPNCYRRFRDILKDNPQIELMDLPTVLMQKGIKVTPQALRGKETVCIHDSCPDRRYHIMAPAVRQLFTQVELREMAHNQQHSHCCGMGRLRFVDDPQGSERRRTSRIKEFEETGADQLVTYCVSCANAFQDADSGVRALHYLELLFAIRIDWDAVFQASQQAMSTWE